MLQYLSVKNQIIKFAALEVRQKDLLGLHKAPMLWGLDDPCLTQNTSIIVLRKTAPGPWLLSRAK